MVAKNNDKPKKINNSSHLKDIKKLVLSSYCDYYCIHFIFIISEAFTILHIT